MILSNSMIPLKVKHVKVLRMRFLVTVIPSVLKKSQAYRLDGVSEVCRTGPVSMVGQEGAVAELAKITGAYILLD